VNAWAAASPLMIGIDINIHMCWQTIFVNKYLPTVAKFCEVSGHDSTRYLLEVCCVQSSVQQ